MASRSRAAQERLVELEKNSAPFEDQLLEAAKFIDFDLDGFSRSLAETLGSAEGPRTSIYHGKQEWLLRWLLKRLQDPKDVTPRQCPDSWILFSHLIQIIPTQKAARLLNERKLMVILRQTLEEAKMAPSSEALNLQSMVESGSEDFKSMKKSNKRKRSGELISTSKDSRSHVLRLPVALFKAIVNMLRYTKATSTLSDGESTTEFSMECMRSVIRIPAEDAARILGAWLSLCRTSLGERNSPRKVQASWISPFIEIWKCRVVGSDDLIHFSLYCSQPLLSLIKVLKTGEIAQSHWMGELEQLLSRNIIVPSKAAKFENEDSDLLNTLTKIFVIQDSANAAILFDIAILSIQVQNSRRRRQNDESWLQTVFTVLKDAMPPTRFEENGKSLREMLQSAIKYKVILDLSILGSIISQYCFMESRTNWELLATIIKLDTNVLLIPDEGKDLLQQVLTRVTAEGLKPSWQELSVQVALEVVIPIMNGFAQARDLTAFIRHWHSQMIEEAKLRGEGPSPTSMLVFSAWEDDLLQAEFSKIMEASLTVTQILQILDWLVLQVNEYPDATCTILEAIAGSIEQEEVADAVGLRLYHIMFDDGVSHKLNEPYKWRSWRMLTRSLTWISQPCRDEISVLWGKGQLPFDVISGNFGGIGDLTPVNSNIEKVEILRFVCAARNVCEKGTTLDGLTQKPVINLLHTLFEDLTLLLQELIKGTELGEERCGLILNTKNRGSGWRIWSSVFCVLVEFPRVLRLGAELEGNTFRDLLQTIFWISSVPQNQLRSGLNPWLHTNPEAYSRMWTALLSNDDVLSNIVLVSLLMDIMLSNTTHGANPLIESSNINESAVHCLLRLPIEVYSKKDRGRVMTSWPPISGRTGGDNSKEWGALDDAIISLKIKMMQRSTIYEGAKYQDLVLLAEFLASADNESPYVSLSFFKELVRRTITHVTANLDQPRNREYVLNALSHLQKKLKIKAGENATQKLNFALISMFEVLFEIFTARALQLNDLAIISQLDLSTLEESFHTVLLSKLQSIISKMRKSSKSGKQVERSLLLRSVIEALANSNVDRENIGSVIMEAKSFDGGLQVADVDTSRRLESFTLSPDSPALKSQLKGDISTVDGRQEVAERTSRLIKVQDESQKLVLLHSSLQEKWSWTQLDKLLAVRNVIISCEDSRKVLDTDNAVTADLSSIYSVFCGRLLHTTSVRQFSLISETMVMMLRTKSRVINQWNVDSTLGDITIMCSRNSPRLRPNRAATIYAHLCQLLQTLLTSYRLQLEGHFHLVVQAMQSLLRCLFIPLRHSNSKISKTFSSPSWLSSPKYQLLAKHAVAFTRLVTLICNPSVSSVTRSANNNLTSATDKAKRIAGQHMHFVLNLYIKLQLEMKMLPDVREKMVPGLYAIFDTTTPEMRRMISDGLDSSGRAVFGMLFKDYQKFGKWKGS